MFIMDIYHRMPNEAGQLVAEGLNHDIFDAVLWEIHFEQAIDNWTREFVSANETARKNILISGVDSGENVIYFCRP